MKKLLVLALVAAAAWFWLKRSPSDMAVAMTELPPGAQVGAPGEMTIDIRDANGQPVDLASLPPEVREQILRQAGQAAGGNAPGGADGVTSAVNPVPPDAPDAGPAKSFTYRNAGPARTSLYIAGWSVLVDRALSDNNTALANRGMTQLEKDLERIAATVPPAAVAALREVPILVSLDSGSARAAEYHWPGVSGGDASRHAEVQISRVKDYLEMVTMEAPWMLLHELAHAYHERVLGPDYAPIRRAFEAARASGQYNSVKHIGGGTDRAYAMTDEREYFAELTESYFGRNDFYPFNRAELKQHDPAGYQMVERAWSRR